MAPSVYTLLQPITDDMVKAKMNSLNYVPQRSAGICQSWMIPCSPCWSLSSSPLCLALPQCSGEMCSAVEKSGLEALEKVSWLYRPILPLPQTDRTISGWFIIRTDYASCPLVFMQSFTMTYLSRLMRLTLHCLIWAKIFWEFQHVYAMCFFFFAFASEQDVGVCVCVWLYLNYKWAWDNQRERLERETYGWQSLMRSWSVVPGGRPRMYKLVLLSCSTALWLLLLVLGLGGAIGGGGGA